MRDPVNDGGVGRGARGREGALGDVLNCWHLAAAPLARLASGEIDPLVHPEVLDQIRPQAR